jgi:subtilisin-like proprotein convertase family protein
VTVPVLTAYSDNGYEVSTHSMIFEDAPHWAWQAFNDSGVGYKRTVGIQPGRIAVMLKCPKPMRLTDFTIGFSPIHADSYEYRLRIFGANQPNEPAWVDVASLPTGVTAITADDAEASSTVAGAFAGTVTDSPFYNWFFLVVDPLVTIAFNYGAPTINRIELDGVELSSSASLPAWIAQTFSAAVAVNHFEIEVKHGDDGADDAPTQFELQGSNDGTVWTRLGNFRVPAWVDGETRKFKAPSLNQSYTNYRIYVESTTSNTFEIASLRLFPAAGAVTASATETSSVSQTDANNAAQASANATAAALLQCVPIYSSTQQHTSRCRDEDIGTLGTDVTKVVTRQSYQSLEEAELLALEDAIELADESLACTSSNNTQKITINDSTGGALAAASPYPSVKYVSGLVGAITKVTVTLTGFVHTSQSDVRVALRSPSGTIVELLRCCGFFADSAPRNIIFDDGSGAAPIGSAIPVGSNTYKPTQNPARVAGFAAPLQTVGPYQTTLASLNGELPNGSWSLWVVDSVHGDAGSINSGWDLTISTDSTPEPIGGSSGEISGSGGVIYGSGF